MRFVSVVYVRPLEYISISIIHTEISVAWCGPCLCANRGLHFGAALFAHNMILGRNFDASMAVFIAVEAALVTVLHYMQISAS